MQHKFKATTGLVFLFLLISSGNQAAAIGGSQLAYLPLIMRSGTWQEVGAGSATGGGISNNTGNSTAPSTAISQDGNPYVAWANTSGGDWEIYVRTWNGNDWVEVGAGSASGGGVSNNNGDSKGASLALAPDGTPYVAWYDFSTGASEIYVRAWNGNAWAEVGAGSASGGGISNNSAASEAPSLAIGPDGTPYVAWHDFSDGGDREIYVRTWNGSSWVEVGAGSASGGGISNNNFDSHNPSVVVGPDSTPYIAWSDSTSADAEIYVLKWNGSNWVEVGAGSASGGGISDNSGDSSDPFLGAAPDGSLYAAWVNYVSGFEIYVKTWNGSNWEEVGVGSASGGGISDSDSAGEPSLAVDPDGRPYVSWNDYIGDDNTEIYIKTWNGSAWVEVGAQRWNGQVQHRKVHGDQQGGEHEHGQPDPLPASGAGFGGI